MFLPIGDTQVKGGYRPLFSYLFIIVNVLVFFYQLSLPFEPCKVFLYTYGNIPAELAQGENLYTLITCMFLHGGWMHLIGNMLFLWIFGDNIEAVFGPFEFIAFYILGGLCASFAHFGFNPDSLIPTVGASGAISAILGCYIVLFPKSKIKVLFVLFLYKWHMPAIWFLGLWFAQNLINGIGDLGIPTTGGGGVAWWAHIGGFIFGLIYGQFRKRNLKVDYSFTP